MAEKLLMLALSPTMETGTIANWLKSEGDTISNGDIICEVETDKATMEYESVQDGTLLKIVVPAGGSAEVEQTIAIIGEEGEDIDDLLAQVKNEKASKDEESSEQPEPEQASGGAADSGNRSDDTPPESGAGAADSHGKRGGADSDGRIKASPLARKLADDAGLSLGSIRGSGPGGRVVKRDVEEAKSSGTARAAAPSETAGAAAPAPVLEDSTIPVSNKRRVIAQRLAESKYSAPHFYLKTSVFTETMMDARKRLNASMDHKVSVNAFLMKFAAEAIKRHPVINSSWQGDTIRQFGSIDIGLAVAQEDGLITPIVRNCGGKGVVAIDQELADLIARAKTNKLAPEEYTGATFSISSLGTFGIEEFTAIINPPGSAILAVGQMQKVPVVNDSDEIEVRMQMKLTLSCDHRVIDGAKGAGFLTELKAMMEEPVRALY